MTNLQEKIIENFTSILFDALDVIVTTDFVLDFLENSKCVSAFSESLEKDDIDEVYRILSDSFFIDSDYEQFVDNYDEIKEAASRLIRGCVDC